MFAASLETSCFNAVRNLITMSFKQVSELLIQLTFSYLVVTRMGRNSQYCWWLSLVPFLGQLSPSPENWPQPKGSCYTSSHHHGGSTQPIINWHRDKTGWSLCLKMGPTLRYNSCSRAHSEVRLQVGSSWDHSLAPLLLLPVLSLFSEHSLKDHGHQNPCLRLCF